MKEHKRITRIMDPYLYGKNKININDAYDYFNN